MQSILLPADLSIALTTFFPTGETPNNIDKHALKKTQKVHYIKRVGSRGSSIKKRGDFRLSQLTTTEGTRLFVSGVSYQQESLILAQLWKQAIGLSRGYRKRLRLVGIGFRGLKQARSLPSGISREVTPLINQDNMSKSKATPSAQQKKILLPKYRIRQLKSLSNNSEQKNTIENLKKEDSSIKRDSLQLKLGYSHDYAYPLLDAHKKNINVDISRPEGRTKGTVILIEGANIAEVSSIGAELQNYRIPDIYKGKGIHADGVNLKLKKGKRQG